MALTYLLCGAAIFREITSIIIAYLFRSLFWLDIILSSSYTDFYHKDNAIMLEFWILMGILVIRQGNVWYFWLRMIDRPSFFIRNDFNHP